MLSKIKPDLKFSKKRNSKLITPCCGKSNKDLKFVNFIGLPDCYGYCHSCGETTLPPKLYKNSKGELFKWNRTLNKLEKTVTQNCYTKETYQYNPKSQLLTNNKDLYKSKSSKIVEDKIVQKSLEKPMSNNLCKYLYVNFDTKRVKQVIKDYRIGTSYNNFTVFWFINASGNAQKSKSILYQSNGKRTNQIRVKFKNEQGYYFCLYGEHLLKDENKPIILVESEKSAIICSIKLPQYNWLAYSGINGLTFTKLHALKNKEILIIPDLSQKAVDVIRKKHEDFKRLNIKCQIYDLTKGKTDEELKVLGMYNQDIADYI